MKYILKNYMEICVNNYIDDIIKEKDGCGCEICKADIKAITLNALPVKYVVSEDEIEEYKLDMVKFKYEDDIKERLEKAVDMVKSNPRH